MIEFKNQFVVMFESGTCSFYNVDLNGKISLNMTQLIAKNQTI